MTEHEAEAFLQHRGWPTPSERHAEYLAHCGGHCRQCFRGDYSEPAFMCGDCEDRAIAADEAREEFLFWDELEFERDAAFDALVQEHSH